MEKQTTTKKSQPAAKEEGITKVTVGGFKSISHEQSIEIRPLTILAGANSSGKSSIMQPLLLLKQTLEASYDPGPLLLNGPNVKFTSLGQIFPHVKKEERPQDFHIGMEHGRKTSIEIFFSKSRNQGFSIKKIDFFDEQGSFSLNESMSHEDIFSLIKSRFKRLHEPKSFGYSIVRERCFLKISQKWNSSGKPFNIDHPLKNALGAAANILSLIDSYIIPIMPFDLYIRNILHLPASRGNPERTYPVTAVGTLFPGTFEKYTASVVAQWKVDNEIKRLRALNKDLERLGLSWGVKAIPIDDTQVELQVSRFTQRGGRIVRDFISIADVGFGVSQTLPILVALQVAKPTQLVYIEQPEIHLHPRAQVAMAHVLADAVNRGVRVVVETHSSLFLLGVQMLVAEGNLSPEVVKLHWFTLGKDGFTKISSADLDDAGAFGNWPEDFADVTLEVEGRYLDAAESRRQKR